MLVSSAIAVLSLLSVASAAGISKDAKCGNAVGKTCLNSGFGNCCSANGWCGSTANYCGTGCQSRYGSCTTTTTPSLKASTNAQCGGTTGFTCLKSTFGNCCSSSGWCGSTSAYCGTGCQPGFGSCTAASTQKTTMSTAVRSTTSASPSSTQAVSDNDRCGPEFGGRTCLGSQYGDCCSQYSYCGSTRDYCAAEEKCQAGFGKCNPGSSSSSSKSSSTSAISSSSKVLVSSSSTGVSTSTPPSSSSSVGSSSSLSSSTPSSTLGSSSAQSSSAQSSSTQSSSATSSTVQSSSEVSSSQSTSSTPESSSSASSTLESSSTISSATPTPTPSAPVCNSAAYFAPPGSTCFTIMAHGPAHVDGKLLGVYDGRAQPKFGYPFPGWNPATFYIDSKGYTRIVSTANNGWSMQNPNNNPGYYNIFMPEGTIPSYIHPSCTLGSSGSLQCCIGTTCELSIENPVHDDRSYGWIWGKSTSTSMTLTYDVVPCPVC